MAYRPMPFDGGYLPVVEMTRAVWDTGFRGVYSMEIFDGGKIASTYSYCWCLLRDRAAAQALCWPTAEGKDL